LGFETCLMKSSKRNLFSFWPSYMPWNPLCSKLVFHGKQLRPKDNKQTEWFHKQVVSYFPVRGWDGTWEAKIEFEVKERTREKRKYNASDKFGTSLSHYINTCSSQPQTSHFNFLNILLVRWPYTSPKKWAFFVFVLFLWGTNQYWCLYVNSVLNVSKPLTDFNPMLWYFVTEVLFCFLCHTAPISSLLT
jgi:hypothetical protein